MSENQFGNHLLYLLSEKQSLNWGKFKEYTQVLKERNHVSNELNGRYWKYSLARTLSAMGYLDIEKNEQGSTTVQIAPPMLIELPFMQLCFLLTGARSPDFIKLIRNITRNSKIAMDSKSHLYLPDTVIIKPGDKNILQSLLENTIFQGNRLSSFIKISDRSVAWDILNFSGNLESYKESLKWVSGNESNIHKVFDTNFLSFKTFQYHKDSLKKSQSLVEIAHSEYHSKDYLFSKNDENMAKINRDWGRFLVSKQSEHQILTYNEKTFELSSILPLPSILERGITLLSGTPSKKKNKKFLFQCVPKKIANLVAEKLEQKLYMA